jgi:hypothetical protein
VLDLWHRDAKGEAEALAAALGQGH